MKIYSTDIITYEMNSPTDKCVELVCPRWEVLVNELITMDKFHKPIIFLHQHAHDPENDWMSVCGGNGIYHVQTCADYKFYQYFDVTKSSKEIDVWTSDQGFSCPEFHLIFEGDLLLKIVRYYYDFGTHCPDVTWEGIDV